MLNHPDENFDTAAEYRAGRPDDEEAEIPADVAAMVGAKKEKRMNTDALDFVGYIEQAQSALEMAQSAAGFFSSQYPHLTAAECRLGAELDVMIETLKVIATPTIQQLAKAEQETLDGWDAAADRASY